MMWSLVQGCSQRPNRFTTVNTQRPRRRRVENKKKKVFFFQIYDRRRQRGPIELFLLESYFVSFFSTWRTRRNKCKGIQSSAKCQRREWGVGSGVRARCFFATTCDDRETNSLFSRHFLSLPLSSTVPRNRSSTLKDVSIWNRVPTTRHTTLRYVTLRYRQ